MNKDDGNYVYKIRIRDKATGDVRYHWMYSDDNWEQRYLWSGFSDKTGHEIYERDVVKSDSEHRWVVYHDQNNGRWCMKNISGHSDNDGNVAHLTAKGCKKLTVVQWGYSVDPPEQEAQNER